MELTPELREAIAVAVGRVWDEVLVRDVHAFEAGYRMGQRDMRERAAKNCDELADSYSQGRSRASTDEQLRRIGARDCAHAIRSLPIEDANG